MAMTIEPVTAALGGVVEGVDLRHPDTNFDAIYRALHRAAGDHWPHRRVVRRLEIDGDRPFFDPSR